MKPRFSLINIALLFGLSIASPALAADSLTHVTQTVEIEESDWSEEEASLLPDVALKAPTASLSVFGPFRVVDNNSVELHGVIDSFGPQHFQRLLLRFPAIRTLRMVDCPGSEDDDANLKLARMIRKAGINTHVPANGSIRSGGVELFLAGLRRTSELGAQFGVHSWVDEDGREAKDYAKTDPVHQEYVKFYQEMGIDTARANAFYSFTNAAAPSSGVYYMTAEEVRRFGLTNA